MAVSGRWVCRQRGALLDYITRLGAKDATELGAAVNQAMPDHAMKMRDLHALAVAGILWKARAAAMTQEDRS